jgi:hypothetical protein
MDKLTDEQISDLIYFWKYKGDLERWSSFEKLRPQIQNEFPEVIKAWEEYKMSIRILDLIIDNLGSESR